MKPLEIIGGGLAGLSLGIALRRRGVPVTVHEAGHYPRHRVCGEFIAGLPALTRRALDLDPLLKGAYTNRTVAWHFHGRVVFRQTLPAPAPGLSRYALDSRLAERFVSLGGDLREGSRVRAGEVPTPGQIWATGRRADPSSPWIGLKVHSFSLPLNADLEFFLGDQAYVGVSRVENGICNCCGLFRRRREIAGTKDDLFFAYLEACGLSELARRIRAGGVDPDSQAAVAAVDFRFRQRNAGLPSLGDAFGMIPPFTGDGMAMAFQSAEEALEPLTAYARGALPWAACAGQLHRRLRRRFSLRLGAANRIHRFLLEPRRQRALVFLARSRLLPFRLLFHCLH